MHLLSFLSGVLLVTLMASACGDQSTSGPAPTEPAREVEATSLLGQPLVPATPPPETLQRLEANLEEARARYLESPNDADAIIWLGRRQAYLGRYREAIDTFSLGLAKHPDDARFYRHRGHRYITTRRFDQAVTDLEKAAALVAGHPDEIEPDGQPNARNIPTSTLQSNIWYHLGLAYYLRGEFDEALRAYEACMKVSTNPDMLVATSHWLYMTLRRLGRDAEAQAVLEPISPDMDIIENGSYHQLLLMYKGLEEPAALLAKAGSALENATLGYGIGNWHLYNGRRDEAMALFRTIVDGGQWASFGAIAAEAELARLGTATSG